MTTPTMPSAPALTPADSDETLAPKKRTISPMWGVVLAATLLIAAFWAHTLERSSLELIRYAGDNPLQGRVLDNALSDPAIKAFHDDPAIQGRDWAAVNALNDAADRATHDTILQGMLAARIFLTSESSMREGQQIIDAYRDRESNTTKDLNFLIVKSLVDEACKGPAPAAAAASWSVDGAKRTPVTADADHNDPAVKKVVDDGVRAAMTAGVSHLCP